MSQGFERIFNSFTTSTFITSSDDDLNPAQWKNSASGWKTTFSCCRQEDLDPKGVDGTVCGIGDGSACGIGDGSVCGIGDGSVCKGCGNVPLIWIGFGERLCGQDKCGSLLEIMSTEPICFTGDDGDTKYQLGLCFVELFQNVFKKGKKILGVCPLDWCVVLDKNDSHKHCPTDCWFDKHCTGDCWTDRNGACPFDWCLSDKSPDDNEYHHKHCPLDCWVDKRCFLRDRPGGTGKR